MIITDTIWGGLTFRVENVICANRIGHGKLALYFNMEGTVKQVLLNVVDSSIAGLIEDIESSFVGDQCFTINDEDDIPIFLKTENIVGAKKYEDCCMHIFFNLSGTAKAITVRVNNADIPTRIAEIEAEINGLPIPP